jgi:hypothetical protein
LLRRQKIIQFLVEAKFGKVNFSWMLVSCYHDSLIPGGITNNELPDFWGQALSPVFRA